MADSGQSAARASRRLCGARRLRARIAAEAQMRDAAAAEKTAALLDQEASDSRGGPRRPDRHALRPRTVGDGRARPPGARAHFDQCSREDEMCKWQAVVAAEKAGDTAGAAAAREQLLKNYGRESGAPGSQVAANAASGDVDFRGAEEQTPAPFLLRYGSVRAINSDGRPAAPTATTMYCLLFAM